MAEEGHSKDKHKKDNKKKKLIRNIAIFAVFQAIVIAVVVLVVFRVRSPKLRLGDIRLQTLATGTPAAPSFDVSFGAEVRIRNRNFGRYKFEATTVSLVYQGIIVGQVLVPEGKVGIRSTKEVEVFASASSQNLAGLAGPAVAQELSAGVLTLSGKAVMRGKVEIMGIVKKKKNAEMDCFILFNLAARMVQRLVCE